MSLEELRGIAYGISADGKIVQAEAEFLLQWLENNKELSESNRAVKKLYFRAEEALRDGKLSIRESKDILETLHRLILPSSPFTLELSPPLPTEEYHTREAYDNLGSLELISSRADIFSKISTLNFLESTFCFTGVFAFGDRKACQKATAELGGEIRPKPLKNGVYLVVGTLASPDWKHGNYGTKIERVLEYQKTGGTSKIIHEDTWAEFLCRGDEEGPVEEIINNQGPLF